MHLRERIALKAAIGFMEQLPCHLQVHGCFADSAVPEVCGEQREHPLYIFPFAIPGQETSHGKRVPKIMKPRLVASTVKSQYAGLFSEPLELMVSMIVTDHHAYLCGEQSRRAFVSEARPMSHSVKSQDADKIFSDRNQPGLAELRFANGQCGIPEIRVLMLQAIASPKRNPVP